MRVRAQKPVWGVSSAGRAPPWHGGGREFDPLTLHQTINKPRFHLGFLFFRTTLLPQLTGFFLVPNRTLEVHQNRSLNCPFRSLCFVTIAFIGHLLFGYFVQSGSRGNGVVRSVIFLAFPLLLCLLFWPLTQLCQ